MLPWDAFLQRYGPLARAIVLALAGPRAEAEDLLQEASLALFAASRKDPDRFSDLEFARNYYLRTVKNLAARSLERRRPTAELPEEPTDPAPASLSAEALTARRTRLAQLLRTLQREDRELVARRFLRRQTLSQVSAETGVPVSTLHNRERRILKLLRKQVEGYGLHD